MSDPVRIGNPNNLEFRSLQDLDEDILPIIAANVRTPLDFADTQPQPQKQNWSDDHNPDIDDYSFEMPTFLSLVLVSRKLHSLWLPLSMEKVMIKTKHLLDFFLLLISNPQLGPMIKSLSFDDDGDNFLNCYDVWRQAVAMTMFGFPHLPPYPSLAKAVTNEKRKMEESQEIECKNIIAITRSMILSECTNLKELSFEPLMDIRFSISKDCNLILPSRIESIRKLKLDNAMFSTCLRKYRPISVWEGHQVLFFLTQLPNLKKAYLTLVITHQEATLIDSHFPEIAQSSYKSKIKNLNLKIVMNPSGVASKKFDSTLCFGNLLSVFEGLKTLTLRIYQDNENIDRDIWAPVDKSPSVSSLRGLKNSFLTLQSLSIAGLRKPLKEREKVKIGKEMRLIFDEMRNLRDLEIELPLLEGLLLATPSSVMLLPIQLSTLQIPAISDKVFERGGREAILIELCENAILPIDFKRLRLPKTSLSKEYYSSLGCDYDSEDSEDLNGDADDSSDDDYEGNFQKTRKQLEKVVEEVGITLELY